MHSVTKHFLFSNSLFYYPHIGLSSKKIFKSIFKASLWGINSKMVKKELGVNLSHITNSFRLGLKKTFFYKVFGKMIYGLRKLFLSCQNSELIWKLKIL